MPPPTSPPARPGPARPVGRGEPARGTGGGVMPRISACAMAHGFTRLSSLTRDDFWTRVGHGGMTGSDALPRNGLGRDDSDISAETPPSRHIHPIRRHRPRRLAELARGPRIRVARAGLARAGLAELTRISDPGHLFWPAAGRLSLSSAARGLGGRTRLSARRAFLIECAAAWSRYSAAPRRPRRTLAFSAPHRIVSWREEVAAPGRFEGG